MTISAKIGDFVRYRRRVAQTLLTDATRAKALEKETPSDLSRLDTWLSFISCPRSGHSLVGALLDAHPDIVMGSEYGILDHFIWGFRRDAIAAILIEASHDIPYNRSRTRRDQPRRGGFTYSVEGQWQGRVRELRVLGDKNGSGDTDRLARRPWLRRRIERTMGVPARFLHMVRNPFDVAATMALRETEKTGRPLDLRGSIDILASLNAAHAELIGSWAPGDAFTLKHEDLVQNPAVSLREVMGWLGLDTSDGYLEACAAICWDNPRKSRERVTWSAADRDAVTALIERTPHLAGYSFDV